MESAVWRDEMLGALRATGEGIALPCRPAGSEDPGGRAAGLVDDVGLAFRLRPHRHQGAGIEDGQISGARQHDFDGAVAAAPARRCRSARSSPTEAQVFLSRDQQSVLLDDCSCRS